MNSTNKNDDRSLENRISDDIESNAETFSELEILFMQLMNFKYQY